MKSDDATLKDMGIVDQYKSKHHIVWTILRILGMRFTCRLRKPGDSVVSAIQIIVRVKLYKLYISGLLNTLEHT